MHQPVHRPPFATFSLQLRALALLRVYGARTKAKQASVPGIQVYDVRIFLYLMSQTGKQSEPRKLTTGV